VGCSIICCEIDISLISSNLKEAGYDTREEIKAIKPLKSRARVCCERATAAIVFLIILTLLIAICSESASTTYDCHHPAGYDNDLSRAPYRQYGNSYYDNQVDKEWAELHRPKRTTRGPKAVEVVRMLLDRLSQLISRWWFRHSGSDGYSKGSRRRKGVMRRAWTWIKNRGFIQDLGDYLLREGITLTQQAVPPVIPVLLDNGKHRKKLDSILSHLNKRYSTQAYFEPIEDNGEAATLIMKEPYPVMVYVAFSGGGREVERMNHSRLRTCGLMSSGSCVLLLVNPVNSLTMIRSEIKADELGIMAVTKLQVDPQGRIAYIDEERFTHEVLESVRSDL